MYVTRPLSHYINNPNSLSLPPEGPNLGYLVIQDEESDKYSCFGMCKNTDLINLPFPQNKNLTTGYSSGDDTIHHNLTFFPVLNQPLSKNRYYVIDAHGKHKGYVPRKLILCNYVYRVCEQILICLLLFSGRRMRVQRKKT